MGNKATLGGYGGLGRDGGLSSDGGLGMDRGLSRDRGLGMDGGLGVDRGLGVDGGLGVDRGLSVDGGLGVQELQVAVRALPCRSWGRRAVSCMSSSSGTVIQTLVGCIRCAWNRSRVWLYMLFKTGF